MEKIYEEKSTNKKIGSKGEEKASIFLAQNGYAVIAKNYRCKRGEIDLVATKNKLIAFVEVKTWPNGDFFSLEYAIDKTKCKHIIASAKDFLRQNSAYKDFFVRFDVIALDMRFANDVYHIENAFDENGLI